MNKNLRYLAGLVVPVLLVAACGGSSDSGGSSESGSASASASGGGSGEPLVVGFAGGLTGDAAVGDVAALEGMTYCIDQVNANGGIDGHPVELIAKDMKSDTALGGTVAQELIDSGVDVLVGPAFPGMAVGVVQAAAAAGIPVLSAVATQPEYTVVGGAPVYLAAFGDNVQAAAAAEYALKEGAKTSFTVSSPDLTYTSNTPKWFAEVFEAGGGKNLGDVTFNLGQTDFSAQVTEIANLPEEPDVIFTAMFPPDTSSFIRALRAAGVKSRMIGADGFDTVALLDAGADAVEGTWFTTHGWNTDGTPFADYVAGVEKANGAPPEAPALSALGCSTVQVIEAAVKAAGSVDPAAIAAALPNLENVETITGTISYAGTTGVPGKTVTIGGIEGGEFVFKDAFVPANIPQP